jgi:hypothetical protein
MHLHVLANGLSTEEFTTLSERFEIRTSKDDGPSGGPVGAIRYDDVESIARPAQELDAAWHSLGVSDGA